MSKIQPKEVASLLVKMVTLAGPALFVAANPPATIEAGATGAAMGSALLIPTVDATFELLGRKFPSFAFSERFHQGSALLSNILMLSTVGMMIHQSVQNYQKKPNEDVGFAAVSLFLASTLSGTGYQALRLLKQIGNRKFVAELFSVLSAFSGSVCFLAAQLLAHDEAVKNNNQAAQKQTLMLTASAFCFVVLMAVETGMLLSNRKTDVFRVGNGDEQRGLLDNADPVPTAAVSVAADTDVMPQQPRRISSATSLFSSDSEAEPESPKQPQASLGAH